MLFCLWRKKQKGMVFLYRLSNMPVLNFSTSFYPIPTRIICSLNKIIRRGSHFYLKDVSLHELQTIFGHIQTHSTLVKITAFVRCCLNNTYVFMNKTLAVLVNSTKPKPKPNPTDQKTRGPVMWKVNVTEKEKLKMQSQKHPWLQVPREMGSKYEHLWAGE